MLKAPIPENELERMSAVRELRSLVNKNPEKRFDDITVEAQRRFDVPISTISVIDGDKEWYKSRQGIDFPEAERDTSFCGHALTAGSLFVIEDASKDERFSDNPSVIGKPFIKFYSGMALFDKKTGLPVAVFCIKDFKPRKLSMNEIGDFMELASRAETELNKDQE